MEYDVTVYPPLEFAPPEFGLLEFAPGDHGSQDYPGLGCCETWSRKNYMPSAIHYNTFSALVGLSYFVVIVLLSLFLSVLRK